MRSRDEFNNHELWDTLENLEAAAKEEIGFTAKTNQYLTYLINDLKKRQTKANCYHVTVSMLNSLNSCVKEIIQQIKNGNENNTVAKIDKCMEELGSRWPANYAKDLSGVAVQTIQDITEKASECMDAVKASAEEMTQLHDQCEEATAACEENVNQLKKQTADEIHKIGADANESVNNLLTETKTSLSEAKDDLFNSMGEINDKTQSIYDEVTQTANATSGHLIAKDYGRYARNCMISRFVYDAFAILISVIAVLLIAWALSLAAEGEVGSTVLRLVISVAAFVISGYLFRRGTYLYRESKAAKRTELTFRTYKPFIANLEEETQKDITDQIARRIFIKGELSSDNDESALDCLKRDGLSTKDIDSLTKLLPLLSNSIDSTQS